MACQRHYEIAVRDPLGNLTDLITNEYICRWTLRANKIGVLILELGSEYCSPVSTYAISSFGPDYRIELRRFIDNTPGLVGNTCFFVTYLAVIQDAGGQRRLRVEAESALGLAGRRTIAYKSNDNASDLEPKLADNQLKRVMRDHFSLIATSYNTAPTADPIRTAIAPYMTIDYPPGPGLSAVDVEMNVAHQPVLQALNQIADASFAKGEPLFFDIQQVSDTANPFLEFVTGIDQLGIDRTQTTGGVNAVVIDTADSGGSISDYTLAMDWKESAYRVYAGSQGRGEEQVFQTADYSGLATLITTDPFALREAYIGTNELTTDTQKIIDQAQAELTKLLPKTTITGTFAENETFQWGVDWDFQDRLTVFSDGLFIDVFVETLDGELNNGEEKITGTFSTTLHRSMSGIAKVVQDTKRLEWWVKHLSALEAPAGLSSAGIQNPVTGAQVVASGYQYLVQGNLQVEGSLSADGEVVSI